jgi:ribosome-binding factor A
MPPKDRFFYPDKTRQYKRSDRVGELIKEEISNMLIHEIKDPRIGFVTLTKVILSNDLRKAKVFISILGEKAEKEGCFEGLRSARGFIRGELGKRLNLRYISIEYGARISQLLANLADKKEE